MRHAGPSACSPNAAREEAEQRQNEHHDQDDPEDSHGRKAPFFSSWRNNGAQGLGDTAKRSPSSRSIAGSTPHRSRSSTYSAAARSARVADGARSARSIRFFAVCSVDTNSITSTR